MIALFKHIFILFFGYSRFFIRAYTVQMLWNAFLIHLGLNQIAMITAFGLTILVQAIIPDDTASTTLAYLITQKDKTKNIDSNSDLKGFTSFYLFLMESFGFCVSWILMKLAFIIFS